MTARPELLVFSDLDGTLIDHETYDWAPAEPALQALRNIGAGVILASSKTAAEIAVLRHELQLETWPALVENGAGVLDENGRAASDNTEYTSLRAVLDGLPDSLRSFYRGFGDMTADEVADLTGLSHADSTRAKIRTASEPGLWHGTKVARADFEAALQAEGVHLREGGRFLTLSFGRNKSDGMAQIIARLRPKTTIALGDAPNDVEMLEAADYGVIIANPHRTPLPRLAGEDAGRILRTQAPGPTGWNAAVLNLLKHLEMMKDNPHG